MHYLLLFSALLSPLCAQSGSDGSLAGTVLRLYHYNVEGDRIQALGATGTAFLVTYGEALYLVSAGHMSQMGDQYARIMAGESKRELVIPRAAWVPHPSALTAQTPARVTPGQPAPPPTVRPADVAVARVPWPGDWRPEAIALGHACDPQEADRILVAGYPKDFLAHAAVQRPLLRQGIVAMKPGAAVIPQAGVNAVLDAGVLVLDMLTLAGNSGSPVFAAGEFASRKVLVGMVTSGDPELALAFAEPLARIQETLAYAASHRGAGEAFWHSTGK
jgi:hypothetical protein